MALSKFSFRNYEFVQQPSKDFECPVCLEILKEPFLTACCGNHFCKPCVDTTKKTDDHCPLCKETMSGIVDKKFQRKINVLQVYCLNRSNGCTWMGELGNLEKHLSVEETNGECKYVLLPCSRNCGQHLFRYKLYEHVNEMCELRSYSCEYCGYSSTCKEITINHHPVCPDYPVTCPNYCMVDKLLKRSSLDEHRLACPEEMVPCSFSDMGCQEKVKRHLLQQHIEANMLQHQVMMCDAFRELKQCNENLKKENAALKQDNVNLKIELNTADFWTNRYKVMSEEVEKTNWRAYLSSLAVLSTSIPEPVSPFIIKWTDYVTKKQNSVCGKGPDFYYTSPFYTHPGGYKIQLRVYPNGVHSGRGTHLSIFCHIMKGENDDCLKWPFRRNINVTILNQIEDNQHFSIEIWKSTEPSVNHIRKPDSFRNEAGWGFGNFLSLSEVEGSTNTKQFLVNDMLYFRVTVTVAE